MSYPFGDNIVETTTTGGTGAYSLGGAVMNFETFVSQIGNGNTAFYVAVGNNGTLDEGEKEIGYGTLTDGTPDTLTRNVLYSTNANAEVDWTAGETKTIYCAPVAEVISSLLKTNSGSTRPAWLPTGGLWIDTDTASAWVLYCYDGGADIALGEINSTDNEFKPYSGGSPIDTKGSDIASASTIDLDAATGDLVDVTGTTTITAITLAEGVEKTVQFTGALTLTHGASLVLPGTVDITTVAGDFAIFRGYAAGVVRCVSYQQINTNPARLPRGVSAIVADDGVTSFTPRDSIGVIIVSYGSSLNSTMISYRTVATNDTGTIAEYNNGGTTSNTTGALTGTTGTDGHVTISANDGDGKIYIENRSGASQTIRYVTL